MRIHSFGEEKAPVIIMLPGSFCNADSMANIIAGLETDFHVLAVDYNGQYAGSEKPFTSRAGEAEEIIRYLKEQGIPTVALVYGQSMGGEMKPTIVKFSGGKPERYSDLLGPICQNAAYMNDETLEREADACVTFDYPRMDSAFQKKMYFFYSKEESAWRFCHRKLQRSYPHAHYKLVSGYGHVGYSGEHTEEYCGWLSLLARGEEPFGE